MIVTFKNLRAEMARAGLGVLEMANEIKISQPSMTKKLAGKIDFKLGEMRRTRAVINDKLGKELTLDYLFGEGASQ